MREMKDSGVEWIGNVPADWQTTKLKHLVSIKKDIIEKEGPPVLSITQNGIKIKDITTNEGQIAESYTHYQVVNPGDFAMNQMDLLTGGVGISQYYGVTSPDYRVFRNVHAESVLDRFLLKILEVAYRNRIFYALGHGAASLGRWRLPREQFLDFRVPLPSTLQQARIADYLDIVCTDIDAAYADTEEEIALLNAYKRATITEAVTKGLDPDAEMKDSGVEWIGKIPAHWQLGRVGFLFDLKLGKMLQEMQKSPEETKENYLTAANIGWSGVRAFPEKTMWLTDLEKASLILVDGDVLIKEGGSAAGETTMYRGERAPCYFQNHLIRARGKNRTENAFLVYWIQAAYSAGYIPSLSDAVSFPNYSKDMVFHTPILWPSGEDLEQIVAHLDSQCSAINGQIAALESELTMLADLKRSLIYDYVTGKAEVPESFHKEAIEHAC